jgi:hypothetical protein
MEESSLPTERKVYQFPHASVVFTADRWAATGRTMPRLYVQVVDAYRYQRELTVAFRHRPGASGDLFWEGHIYRHPHRREVSEIDERTAKRFIVRFLYLCDNYPTLLFNEADPSRDRPQCEGFVHLAERLHDEPTFSANMLA